MIPILYEKNETLFRTNGLGRLRDVISCECTEERNGIFEVTFEYPTTGIHFAMIIPGRYIAVKHDESGKAQPFEIYAASKPINGIVTFKAFHISYKQRNLTVSNGTAIYNINDAFSLLKNNSTPSNPFTYWTDITSTNYMSGAEGAPKTVRQLLGGVEGSILDAYGGEYEWDKWQVKLHKSRGVTRDLTIRYGVNMLDYQDDSDFSGTYNAVIPYWTGQDDNGNELVVKGGVISSGATMYNGDTACVPLDLTSKFQTKPTVAALETEARSYLRANQPALPAQTIKVDFLRLQDSPEYAQYKTLQYCRLCDLIRVVFPLYGTNAYFKIVKTVYDVLLERYTSMELGTLSTSLSDAMGVGQISGDKTANQPTGIIESGTDGIWTWRKWADGTAECWGTSASRSITSWSQWGGLYYGNPYTVYDNYPSGLFIDSPSCQAQVANRTGDMFLVAGGSGNKDHTLSFYPARGATWSGGTYTYTVSYYAIGKWK